MTAPGDGSTRAAPAGTADGRPVLRDVRYRPFDGSYQPRWRAVVALARSSALRALGVGRGTGAKVWPGVLLAASYAPAVVAVGGVVLLPDVLDLDDPRDLVGYGQQLSATTVAVLAWTATVVPSLLTRERRDRVLPLWFATAVSPAEYVAAKVLAALGLLLLVVAGPLLVLCVGTVGVADAPWEAARDVGGDLPRVLAAALAVATFHAAAGLALGSTTTRRVLAVGAYLALLLVSTPVAAVAADVTRDDTWLAGDLTQLPVTVGRLVLDQPADGPFAPDGPAVAVWALVVGLSAVVLAARHRRDADA